MQSTCSYFINLLYLLFLIIFIYVCIYLFGGVDFETNILDHIFCYCKVKISEKSIQQQVL